jgi:hypothetical protein
MNSVRYVAAVGPESEYYDALAAFFSDAIVRGGDGL